MCSREGKGILEHALKRNSMKTTVLAICLWIIPIFICAQSKFETGFFLGGSSYQGDLSPVEGLYFPEIKPAFGIINRIKLSDYFNLRLNLIYAQISGADANFDNVAYRQRRDASFKSNIFETSFNIEWEFLPIWTKRDSLTFSRRKILSPYLFGGIGASYFSNTIETRDVSDFSSNLRMDLEEDYPQLVMTVPFGGGIHFPLGTFTSVRIESGLRYNNTDFLDGISSDGNPDTKDWTWYGGVNLGFSFASRDSDKDGVPDKVDACPRIKGSPLAKGCPDADEDGVEDAEDLCPEVRGIPDLNGCPDTDGDGIADLSDGCPMEYGFEDTDGCPDRDNDCIPDAEDKCPDIEGLAIYEGCIDSDQDSISDILDRCPNEAGLAENNGCPFLDTDCDGVLDKDDECPEIEGNFGFSGCPDEDEDGLPDKDDNCPAEAGTLENQGCPELSEEAVATLTEASKKVKFRSGRSSLLTASKETLDEVVELMKNYPNYELTISGYTDDRGRASSNLKLSESRAKACFEYIVEKGIDPDRMTSAGFGEDNPIGNNKTAAGRERNRRVEFEMKLKSFEE